MKLWPWPRRRSTAPDASLAPLTGIHDLHCHLLPGIDDGARDLDAAVAMCRIAVDEGVTTAVATPHTLDGVHDVERRRARQALAELRAALAAHGLPLDLRLAAEVRYDEGAQPLLARAPDISLDGAGKFLLVELPHDGIPPGLDRFVFALRASGTTPVIAHPERNLGVRSDPDVTAAWLRAGVLLQLTAGSITGRFGPVIGACADRLLRQGRVHLVASDAHSTEKRPPRLQAAYLRLVQVVGGDGAAKLLVDNPARILAGRPIAEIQPVAAKARNRRTASNQPAGACR